jgi:hypothetical protein
MTDSRKLCRKLTVLRQLCTTYLARTTLSELSWTIYLDIHIELTAFIPNDEENNSSTLC